MPATATAFHNNPDCDLCKKESSEILDLMGVPGKIDKAKYDGATHAHAGIGSKWAYMCQDHFDLYGKGLGTGVGQELI
jgi:hypothetical protein